MKLHEALHLVRTGRANKFYNNPTFKYFTINGKWYCNRVSKDEEVGFDSIKIVVETDQKDDWMVE